MSPADLDGDVDILSKIIHYTIIIKPTFFF